MPIKNKLTFGEEIAQIAREKLAQIEGNAENILSPEEFAETSGEQFWQAVLRHGRSDNGNPLTLLPWHEEYCRLIGDLRIPTVIITGAAQIGKTAFVYLLFTWLTCDRWNGIWVFPQERSLTRSLKTQYRPIRDYWLDSIPEEDRPKITTSTDAVTVIGKSNAFFSYAQTSGKSNTATGVQVGSALASISGDFLVLEEQSQYPASVADVAHRRLDASRLPSQPKRPLGTPGGGNGIEAQIKRAHYSFFPGVICQKCDRLTLLHPFGALLKKTARTKIDGSLEESYVSSSGAPENFHSHVEGVPEQAYIGCQHCNSPISDEHRLNALFYDEKTYLPLAQFLQEVPERLAAVGGNLRVGITLSPLLRQTKYNLAAKLIQEGLDSENPADWMQQNLGLSTEQSATGITYEQIDRAVKREASLEASSSDRFIYIAGIDQARGKDLMVVIKYLLPEGWESMGYLELASKAFRNVLFAGQIMRGQVIETLRSVRTVGGKGCDFILMDNEPDRDSAWQMHLLYPKINLADQTPGLKMPYQLGKVLTGGEEIDSYKIRAERYQRAVVDCFFKNLCKVPGDWYQYRDRKAGYSPYLHMTSVTYDINEEKWVRPSNHNDDLFFAWMFAEAGFEIYLEEMMRSPISWYSKV
jgi:hypothetical protein